MQATAFGVHIPVMGFAKPQIFERDLVVSYAQQAESLGYDFISVNDRVVFRKSWLDPISTLAAVAVTTRSIKLGTSILNIVVRNPDGVRKIEKTTTKPIPTARPDITAASRVASVVIPVYKCT